MGDGVDRWGRAYTASPNELTNAGWRKAKEQGECDCQHCRDAWDCEKAAAAYLAMSEDPNVPEDTSYYGDDRRDSGLARRHYYRSYCAMRDAAIRHRRLHEVRSLREKHAAGTDPQPG